MNQKLQITIPEPCKEGWQNMTPVEKGRFCASCQKKVLDFTFLSDNEIINLVSKNDTLCGRINVSQLNRNLIETKTKSHYFGYFATSVLAFLGFGTSTIVAQEQPLLEQTDFKYLNKVSDSVKNIIVTGVVKDSDGMPLPGAMINSENSEKYVQTDEFGKYIISANLNDTLQFMFLGFENFEIEIKSSTMNVQLIGSENIIGQMIFYKKQLF